METFASVKKQAAAVMPHDPRPEDRLCAEDRLLQRIRRLCPAACSRVYPVGIGDDCAVRNTQRAERLVYTTDAMVEGVHFSFDWMSPAQVGEKCLAVNISDCAAMGAAPESALVELIMPPGPRAGGIAEALYRGMRRACRRWNCAIVGGNISAGPCWIVSVSMTGRMPAATRPLLRNGAQPGDRLWVSGAPGEAAAGLAALEAWGRDRARVQARQLLRRHVAPQPRVQLGMALARKRQVHAMMDLSDGLSLDAQRLAIASNVRLVLESDALPLSRHAVRLGRALGRDPLDWLLRGGEDYELLFCASNTFDPHRLRLDTQTPLTCIGRALCGAPGVFLADHGKLTPLTVAGWDHLRCSLPKTSH